MRVRTIMLQFDEYKVKLNNLAPTLEELGQALDLEGAERELDMLQAESAADGFWNNLEKAQKYSSASRPSKTRWISSTSAVRSGTI